MRFHHIRDPIALVLGLGTIMGVNPGICAAGLFAVIAVLDVVVVNLLI